MNKCDFAVSSKSRLVLKVVFNFFTGFRNNSRKIVIFMTDQGSHIAGDGRLAGIFTPNDGNCHTGAQFPGHYSKSLDMDYPSIEQVRFQSSVLKLMVEFKDRKVEFTLKG